MVLLLVVNKKGYLNWWEFEKGLISLYDGSSSGVTDYSGELTRLKQEGSSNDAYKEEFIRLSHQIHGLSEEFLVNYFISGLRNAIRFELIAKRPTLIIEAMRLAKVEEEKAFALKKSWKGMFSREESVMASTDMSTTSTGIVRTELHPTTATYLQLRS